MTFCSWRSNIRKTEPILTIYWRIRTMLIYDWKTRGSGGEERETNKGKKLENICYFWSGKRTEDNRCCRIGQNSQLFLSPAYVETLGHRVDAQNRADKRTLPTSHSASVDHKLSILRDQDLRESLRRNGIKVSTDLTPRQRDEIHDHKQAGRVAYFRSGRLHVEDKPAGSKYYREYRRQSLRSSAEQEVSASSVKDHHRVSHPRQDLGSSSEQEVSAPSTKGHHRVSHRRQSLRSSA